MAYNYITIAGKVCTGKSTLVKKLHEELKWKTQSSGVFFREYARKHNLSILHAEEQSTDLAKKVDYALRETLKDTSENMIIDAWMSGIMAEGLPNVLTVLLTCPDDERIRRYMFREGESLKVAQKEVFERETQLLKKLSEIYDRDDILDPNLYNIVIDTSQFSIDEAADVILKKLHETNNHG